MHLKYYLSSAVLSNPLAKDRFVIGRHCSRHHHPGGGKAGSIPFVGGLARLPVAIRWFLLTSLLVFLITPPLAGQTLSTTSRLAEYLPKVQPNELFTGADRFGNPVGEPAIVPVWRGKELEGYAYLNSDFTSAIGYSGKPIRIVVGIDTRGVLRGLKMVEHHEPIVLIGIPEQRVIASLNTLIDCDIGRVAAGGERPPQVDIVSGATVTVLVIGDSVVRSAVRLIRSGRLGGVTSAEAAPALAERPKLDLSKRELRSWEELIGDGSIRSLQMTVGEVTNAFQRAGKALAAGRSESQNPDDRFIELFVAPVSVPEIGMSLLGKEGFERLQARLGPDRHAIVVAGRGAYSFKGSGYVRGGIFDRIELIQDGQGVRFRDREHTRLASFVATGVPQLNEIALFTIPQDFSFDVTAPWELQLLVLRGWSARERATLAFDLGYSLPARYLTGQLASSAATPAETAEPSDEAAEAEPLWMTVWRMNAVSIGITIVALLALTAIFFFQNSLVRRPVLFTWTRRAYLCFVLIWLGWYANAQLSVVNVLTFTNAFITGFHWEFFLAAPLIFILWAAIAAGLLFWGRGPFCGWLCPFGALQELTNSLARWFKVPQIKVPFALHERLWPIKYMIFLGLFSLSLYSLALAEVFAEVEPFKTAIILNFVREWPFVLFAVGLLVVGLFIERFYCRYLCPLGAALAIPGRIRMFEWLKRWPECGSPCQRCAVECPVQSIHPEGQINVNECIYCMHCQELYNDDYRCPHMIQVRLKREKYARLSSPSMRSDGPKSSVIMHKSVPIARSDAGGNPAPLQTEGENGHVSE
ncbi:NosR/NirI family protein [Sphingosinicella microcystinivorans]|uniref:NosR/NirI family protein n=1 Tax=Sphingosinicella microcystinivorans TaxID=335406 RepID=UPI0022F3BFF0|nr:NosR/NirI family protein [Sphingosinicella microcystinivorans]WBX82839.1 4Fe-4S binding protein [Sphingosinicella microcystinivorans]